MSLEAMSVYLIATIKLRFFDCIKKSKIFPQLQKLKKVNIINILFYISYSFLLT
mgnify:CR=1 FL=1